MIEITPENDKIITLSMARECFRGCPNGWESFAIAHGYDWKIVVRKGIPASELNAIDDVMAKTLVEYAYKDSV